MAVLPRFRIHSPSNKWDWPESRCFDSLYPNRDRQERGVTKTIYPSKFSFMQL